MSREKKLTRSNEVGSSLTSVENDTLVLSNPKSKGLRVCVRWNEGLAEQMMTQLRA